MTPFEELLLRYMATRGSVSWAELRNQFVMSEGALTVVVNSLKRRLLIQQDGLYYRVTSFGAAALVPKETRGPFGGESVAMTKRLVAIGIIRKGKTTLVVSEQFAKTQKRRKKRPLHLGKDMV